ncbi:hypothetical protein PENFLA_c081G00855 [Penicillium flavigenum]|uniref:GS catalytic domain-containing protein n=1 Tax=Penicillium flavigenum TaxID=254877 RepID=A0A1V6SAC3_9EURO|nr:hypothetical protein PENFLA_c081G00855 [Penicillium flavigenum]
MVRNIANDLAAADYQAFAGVEFEFMNFETPPKDGYNALAARRNLAAFLRDNAPATLRTLTDGMFGYSVTRPTASRDYFFDIIGRSMEFGCPLGGWHTESGPGVIEGALKVCDFVDMADRVTMFKFLARSLGTIHGVTPCFMAKPFSGLSGNSGHIHISLADMNEQNLFAPADPDTNAPWSDVENLSHLGRHFLAAPTVNSYKRLVENYWAPVHLSWGLEDRTASIRLIAPPTCKPQAIRFEVRVPGADLHPHYTLSAFVSAGWRGVQKKLELRIPPLTSKYP